MNSVIIKVEKWHNEIMRAVRYWMIEVCKHIVHWACSQLHFEQWFSIGGPDCQGGLKMTNNLEIEH